MHIHPVHRSAFCFLLSFLIIGCGNSEAAKQKKSGKTVIAAKQDTVAKPAAEIKKQPERLDTAKYNRLMLHMVHDSASARWPVKTAYPLPGAILPFNRIIAYYGNFYSRQMGILGELEPEAMLAKLMGEVKKWQAADTTTKAIPAIHYIVVSAQGSPGKGNKYRLRMPFTQIDKALELAKKVDGLVFLDIQVGWSTLKEEIPLLEKYLAMPNVHLAIDPEFSMKTERKPGSIIGTFDAADINYATGYLAQLVKQNNLPPKVLIIHRFTQGMVTNYKNITMQPEVQVVMDMDGWGFPAKKVSSYKLAILKEPVQFTGFKLFYKNDLKKEPHHMMTPEEVLKKTPNPIYIQYQ